METTLHPKIGEIRKMAFNEGFLSWHVNTKRMVFVDQWGETSYPMMTMDNQKVWQQLRKG